MMLNKRDLSFTVFAIINTLFSIKYFSRYTDYYLLFAVALLFIQIFLFYKRDNLIKVATDKCNIINITILAVFCLASIYLFSKIPAKSSNSDRWSVITSFWDSFFNGEYVYYAKSHLDNYPGPMPFYFILALPFYFIGELGLFSLMGIIVFYFLMRYIKTSPSFQTIFLLLILSSPFYLWEISVRSNIFLNSTIVVFSIVFIFKIINKESTTETQFHAHPQTLHEGGFFGKDYNKSKFSNVSLKNQLLMGLVLGLMMSTRNIFALCYVILFLYFLKNKQLDIISTLKIGCFAIFIFFLTFIPFISGHVNDFMQMNPFIIQSSYLMPVELSIFAVFCSFFMFLFCRKELDVFFYSGVILFLTITMHLLYHSFDESFQKAIFESYADISYFILCIPFFLYYMLKTDNKKIVSL